MVVILLVGGPGFDMDLCLEPYEHMYVCICVCNYVCVVTQEKTESPQAVPRDMKRRTQLKSRGRHWRCRSFTNMYVCMYVCMYVEAPEGSKTVSLSLSLRRLCTGLEGKGALGTPASLPLTTKD